MTTRQAQVAAAKLARKAAAVIEERGWCKGRFTNKKGNVCLLGAMNLAAGATRPDDFPATRLVPSRHLLESAVIHELGDANPADWNDAKARRKRHVLKLLNAVADKLQAGEYE